MTFKPMSLLDFYFISKLGQFQSIDAVEVFLNVLALTEEKSLINYIKAFQSNQAAQLNESFPGFTTLKWLPVKEDTVEKYEYRLFWPSSMVPCFLDITTDLFEPSSFSHKEIEDFYIVGDPSLIIKIRSKICACKNL